MEQVRLVKLWTILKGYIGDTIRKHADYVPFSTLGHY